MAVIRTRSPGSTASSAERASTGDGTRAGYLVVRQYGFDLDDVPDKEKNVREALRGSLGALKLRAETLAGPAGAAADRGPARVPKFPVWGRR